jgi:pilus assembly protein Flp/PilA
VLDLLSLLDLLTDLAYDDRGATAVEYSLIATLVSIAAIVGMKALGVRLMDVYWMISSDLDYGLAKVGL